MGRKRSDEPTTAQLAVLRYIVSHVEEKGYQPSQQEMATHFGITKPSLVSRLKELERRGLTEMFPNRERGIRLVYVRFRAHSI